MSRDIGCFVIDNVERLVTEGEREVKAGQLTRDDVVAHLHLLEETQKAMPEVSRVSQWRVVFENILLRYGQEDLAASVRAAFVAIQDPCGRRSSKHILSGALVLSG